MNILIFNGEVEISKVKRGRARVERSGTRALEGASTTSAYTVHPMQY